MSDSRPLLAALWMLGAIASFSAMAVAGRMIAAELNTFELMFYRSVIGVVIVLALLSISAKGFAQVRTRRMGAHVQRNVVHFAAQNLWFYGVAVIPLAQLVSLEFTNPIWVAILAPFFLGEKMTRARLLAATLGFIGVLVVARPGVAPFELGHAAGLGAAIGFALNTLYTKTISRTDTVLCVLFWMTLMQAGFGLILSLPGGIPWPSNTMWIWVGVVGVCGLTAHLSLTTALSVAPATIVAPMEFARLPVVTALGMWLFGEALEISVLVGAVIIVLGNLINILSEQKRQNAQN